MEEVKDEKTVSEKEANEFKRWLRSSVQEYHKSKRNKNY